MNCPGHCAMYNIQQHSYKDLPIRYADFGILHRN
jgi:threonyl-tRNA synthetase